MDKCPQYKCRSAKGRNSEAARAYSVVMQVEWWVCHLAVRKMLNNFMSESTGWVIP